MAFPLRTIAFCLALLAALGQASAQERIELFVSDVALQVDGSAEVTETIRILSQGQDIRRGIIRDVTNVLDGSGGARVVNEYEVHSVTRDEAPEPFEVTKSGRQFHIQIGNPERLLPPGQHDYVIRYRLSRIARAFEDHDEIYWNATGNDWQFRIDKVIARISLPEGGRIENTIYFTGLAGATGKDATERQTSSRMVEIATTAPLDPGEGLTVAVAFNKGVIAFPEGAATLAQAFKDRMDLIIGSALALVSILFNLFAWRRYGRDSKPGIIFPRFYPPKDMSPATVSYVANHEKFQSEAFTAGLFGLAAQGMVELKNDQPQKSLTVSRTSKGVPPTLSAEESVVLDAITLSTPLVLDGKESSHVQTLYSRFLQTVRKANKRKWVRPNTGLSFVGFALLLALFAWTIGQDETLDFWAFGLVFCIIFYTIISSFLRKLLGASREGIAGFIAVVVVVGAAYLFGLLSAETWPGLQALPLVVGALAAAVFLPLMSAVTPEGRAVLDEIEGFRMYLKTAEQDLLNMAQEPELSTERFEAVLPYAIALKLEKPWTQRFENYLAKAIAAGTAIGAASSLGSFDVSTTQSAVQNVARSVRASTTSSSSNSSSGFSGGSSGGGSGGGGGRGW